MSRMCASIDVGVHHAFICLTSTHAGAAASAADEETLEEMRGDCANAMGMPWEWRPSAAFYQRTQQRERLAAAATAAWATPER